MDGVNANRERSGLPVGLMKPVLSATVGVERGASVYCSFPARFRPARTCSIGPSDCRHAHDGPSPSHELPAPMRRRNHPATSYETCSAQSTKLVETRKIFTPGRLTFDIARSFSSKFRTICNVPRDVDEKFRATCEDQSKSRHPNRWGLPHHGRDPCAVNDTRRRIGANEPKTIN